MKDLCRLGVDLNMPYAVGSVAGAVRSAQCRQEREPPPIPGPSPIAKGKRCADVARIWTAVPSAIFVFVFLLANGFAAEVSAPHLTEAIAAHEAAVKAAKAEVDAAFRVAIKQAANAEHLDELQSLLDARRGFLDRSEVSDTPAVQSAIDQYKEKRKTSARSVVEAYHSEIEAVAKLLRLEEATQLRQKMNAFINEERVAIGLPADPRLVAAAPDVSTAPTESTQEYLENFVTQLTGEVERVSKLHPDALQKTEFRAMCDKMGKEFQRHRLVFRFPIDDVQEEVAGTSYDLDFGHPIELRDIHYFSSLGGRTNVRLTEAAAGSIRTDYVWDIRGTGRIVFGYGRQPENIPRSQWVATITVPFMEGYYYIYLSDFKANLRKMTNEEREEFGGTRTTR
jgi:hypothetical protein